MSKIVAVIPARFASKRLPGKPLRTIDDLPLIAIMYERVKRMQLFDAIVVATDDERIAKVVQAHEGLAIMTSPTCCCGTERVAEIATTYPADLYVNIQGDEVFITKEPVKNLIECFSESAVQVATPVHSLSVDEARNPNRVKAVLSTDNHALYFSRSPIPFYRAQNSADTYWGHIGIYAYTPSAVQQFYQWGESPLEHAERLEQLRFLEHHMPIRVIKTTYTGFGIDTENDLKKAQKHFAQRSLFE